jgi:hypothetical protein
MQGEKSERGRAFGQEGGGCRMVAIVTVDGDKEAAVGVSIHRDLFYSLRAFQKASVSSLVDFRPAAGFSANRFVQLMGRDFFGDAGDKVANVVPWRVMATRFPSSIHLATWAK